MYHWLKIYAPLLVISLLNSSVVVGNSDDWKLEKEKDDIKVYTRIPDGLKFKEYKAVAYVDLPIEKLVEALLEVDSYPQWMSHVKLAERLETPSKNTFVVYSEVSLPWPFQNRDEVAHTTVEWDSMRKSCLLSIEILEGYLPDKKGIQRINYGYGSWRFVEMEKGTTEVTHQFVSDPGGNIPSWVVNLFIVDGPMRTIRQLEEHISEK